MSTDDADSIEDHIARAGGWINKERPRASFFAWPDRQVAEAGIVRTFADAANAEPGFPLTNTRSALRVPPDCIGMDSDGRHVAIEVTELASGEANALAKRDRSSVMITVWTKEKFLQEVQACG